MGLNIVEHDDLTACTPQAWDALAARCPEATVFQSAGWLWSWWESFRQPDWRLRLFAAHDGDRLIGLAPLYERGAPNERSMHFVGEEHADYNGFIVEGGAAEVIEALLDAAVAAAHRRTRICLDETPNGSALQCVLDARERAQPLRWVRTGRTPCPLTVLRGDGIDASALLNKGSLRRHRSALARLGRLEHRHERRTEDIEPHLTRFFDFHTARWSRTVFPSLFEKEANRAFYRRLTGALSSSDRLLFSTLSLDGVPIAYHFGLLSNDKLLWYKPSFDERFARFSPGEVLLGALLEYAIEAGLSAFDFTRGDEPFKRRFASHVHYNCSYARPGSTVQAAIHHGRSAARRTLNRLGVLRSTAARDR